MPKVGVRQLKNRLSEQLRAVKAGGEIIVTEHGQDIARISPVDQCPAWLRAMVASGAAGWQGGKPRGADIRPRGKGKSASEYVLDMRR